METILCDDFYFIEDVKKYYIDKFGGANIRRLNVRTIKELGFKNINLLFNSNPYILNKSDKEIEKLYNKKKEEGLNKDEIIDFISYNTIF